MHPLRAMAIVNSVPEGYVPPCMNPRAIELRKSLKKKFRAIRRRKRALEHSRFVFYPEAMGRPIVFNHAWTRGLAK